MIRHWFEDHGEGMPVSAVPRLRRRSRVTAGRTSSTPTFTSFAFPTTLRDAGIRISMDERGRWMDNVFIGRLRRSLKDECVFLNAIGTGSEARAGIGSWTDYYNRRRPHTTFDGRPPDEVCAMAQMTEKRAA